MRGLADNPARAVHDPNHSHGLPPRVEVRDLAPPHEQLLGVHEAEVHRPARPVHVAEGGRGDLATIRRVTLMDGLLGLLVK